MKQLNVFPECNVDTNLVGFILGGYAKHKSCCNEVVKAVNSSDNFAIGIIDADKRPATMDPGFSEYIIEPRVDGQHRHVAMFIHEDGKRFMFTVKPAMDKFILDAANYLAVDLKQAGFPTSLKEFKKQTKCIQAAKDGKLRSLFALIADYPELQRLRNTLKYLISFQYEVDMNVVRQLFDGTLSKDDLAGMLNE